MHHLLPSFLLALREGAEVTFLLGIVFAGLRQLRRPDCANVVWMAVGTAAIVSAIFALLLRLLKWELHGAAEAIFEGLMLISAAGLLTWMIHWMHRRSRMLSAGLIAEMCAAMGAQGRRGIFVLTFVAVLREGIELAVFLTAIDTGTNGLAVASGAALGLGVAALLGGSLFATTMKLQMRHVFTATSLALVLVAAGMIARGIHEFEDVGWIPPLIDPVWNTSAVLSERSWLGSALKGLFGYLSTPSLTVALSYVGYLAATAWALRPPPHRSSTSGTDSAPLPLRTRETQSHV